MAAGDSLVGGGTIQSSVQSSVLSRFWWTWAAYLLGTPFKLELATNKGVSANTSTQLLARYDADVIAQTPATVFLLIGTNDLGSISSSTTISNIAAMLQKNRTIGAVTVLAKLIPRGSVGSPMTAPQRTDWETVNAWIASQPARDVIVVDLEAAIGNMDANHTLRVDCTVDNLHLSIRGGYRAGKATADQIRSRVASGSFLATANNAPGNLLPNGFLTGTGGTLAGTATGTVATSWIGSNANAGGAAAAFSLVARPDGYGNWQQVAVTGNYTGSARSVHVFRTIVPTGISIGETVKIAAEIEVDANPVGLLSTRLSGLDQASNQLICLGLDSSYFASGPDSGYTVTVESLPYTFAVAPTSLNVYLLVYLDDAPGSSPVNVTARLGRVQVVKV